MLAYCVTNRNFAGCNAELSDSALSRFAQIATTSFSNDCKCLCAYSLQLLFDDCCVPVCICSYVELFSIILHCLCYAQLSYYMLYAVYLCFRLHHYTEHKMRPIVTGVTWSVCVSVCLLCCHTCCVTFSYGSHIRQDRLSSATHTHTHLTALFSRTTRVIWYQKCKTSLDFTEARDSEWQWHQLGHMQVCT